MVKKDSSKPRDFNAFCSHFGNRVKTLRLSRGLTQEAMRDHGFSLRHFQRIESGRSVTLKTLWKLAEAFSVEPHQLLK